MINKNRLNENIKKNWFKCPNKLFSLGLPCNAISVYCYMLTLSEHYTPSIRELSKALKIGRRSVYRAIETLIEAEMIMLEKPASQVNNKSAEYSFRSPDRWQKLSDIKSHLSESYTDVKKDIDNKD